MAVTIIINLIYKLIRVQIDFLRIRVNAEPGAGVSLAPKQQRPALFPRDARKRAGGTPALRKTRMARHGLLS